ncbi:MAG: PrpR N-terminal domain-containing protein [Ruthenibacterium lactatiformans]
MPSIKVLAISPYPGMVPLLTETAKEYDGLELTISVGDLAKGLELAQKGFHANFDVIISRGGTARLLKQSVSLPVIEIGTTVYDVLCTLQRANIHEGRVAIVGYSNITQDMGILRTLLPYQLDVFTIQSSSQAVTTLQYLRRENMPRSWRYGHHTAAKEMDVNASLSPPALKASAPRSTRLFSAAPTASCAAKTSSCASSCTNAPARP